MIMIIIIIIIIIVMVTRNECGSFGHPRYQFQTRSRL